jgi:3-oxoacyl-[acyl-carrier protein] reductase
MGVGMTGFKSFEEIQVGDSASLERVIEAEDVRRFVALTGDDNPLHVDRAYAETTPFKDVVVHGMLGASFLSTLIGTQLPGKGALWLSQSLEFVAPVRLGDRLRVVATVEKKHERDRLLELDTRIENQSRQLVLKGHGTVRVLEVRAPAVAEARPRPRVAVVAGGAGGIGRAICRRLALDGWKVVIGYRGDAARAEQLAAELVAAGGGAVAVGADLASPTGAAALVEAAVRGFGGVGLAVHAASGSIAPAPLEDLRWEDLQAHLDVQVKGAFLLAKACVGPMKAQAYGRIVAITSQVLDGAPPAKWTAYTVGKGGLAALVRSLAQELGPAGITVNAVAPGMTETALVGNIPEKARLMVARAAPLRRLATPEDVAGAVAWLASPGADYVTGETVRINGGQVMV